jgi:aryl-alcohol dehydrogenase-like predicted oxidoreductase
MEHRSINGLSVSVVGLGCNQFGTKACDESTSRRIIDEAIDAGITFFDTADEYGSNYFDPTDPEGWGRSEEIVGRAVASRRDDVIIASKVGSHPHGDHSTGGSSARWIRTAAEDSLRRLGTDRIDLYQLHFPDPTVPIAETLTALDELVRAGKVREVGCCNFSATELRDAASTADALGVRRLVSAQDALNLFQQRVLDDVIPACADLEMSFLPYYPLASGMLTGKYRRGQPIPAGTRITDQVDDETRARILSDRAFARVEALEAFAEERGHTLLELAFGWLLAQPTLASVIAGAARPGQVTANARAGGWRLTTEEAAEAAAIVAAVV